MSFDTSWNIEKYKVEHESDEHWQLRKAFIEAHKNKYPEQRLICLAQVFTNVELLGCRYPKETMDLVSHLSKGIADDFREKQKSRLQRTFVSGSDAAGDRIKGRGTPQSRK